MAGRFSVEIRKPLISLLVGGVAIGIAVNAVTELIVQKIGREWTVALAVLAAVAIVVFAKPMGSLTNAFWRLFQATVLEVKGPVGGHRGLIVMASPGPGIASAERAIGYHQDQGSLEHCWLVTGGPASERSAAGLIDALVGKGFPLNRIHSVALSEADSDNPEAVYRRIDALYDEAATLGLREDDVIGDYTGGTKSMTAGMILACAGPLRHLQFMKPHRSTPDGRAEPGTDADPVAVDIRFKLVHSGGG
jgi:hypothetical protein